MTAARIICIGSPYQAQDWVGPAVFAQLHRMQRAPDVELIDGGLQGLNLLCLLEGMERVVFADTLTEEEDGATGSTVWDMSSGPPPATAFDHAGGLSYLLQAAPLVVDPLPRIWVVGARADASPDLVPELARTCLALASA